MDLNISKDFGQINVSSQRHVDRVINKIKEIGLGDVHDIILNLENCQTDYPETPKLIDFILVHLSKLEGKKELQILFNGLGNKEIYLLHDIILEGNYFGIHNKIDSEDEVTTWTKIMNEKLIINNILLTIIYTPENKKYTYGKIE